MARRSPGPDDGMELLLDTICNTFGGVVFLALLVCLMNQQVSDRVQPASTSDDAVARDRTFGDRQSKLQMIVREAEGLEATRRRQAKLVEILRSDVDAGTLAQASATRSELRTELARASALLEASERLRTEADARARDRRRAKDRLEEARRSVRDAETHAAAAARERATAEAEARAARDDRTVRLRLPRARPTGKEQVAVLLSGGRLRTLYTYRSGGSPVGYNDAELTVDRLNEAVGPADMKPNTGIAIADTPACWAALDARLSLFRPATSYVAVAVWPDSYDAFRLVRDHLTGRGFDYQLLLMPSGDRIGIGTTARHEVQ